MIRLGQGTNELLLALEREGFQVLPESLNYEAPEHLSKSDMKGVFQFLLLSPFKA